MSLLGVNVNKAESGRRNPVADFDRTAALALYLPVPLPNLEYGKPVRLIQTADAEALGLDAAYDATHSVLAHTHISEFFRIAPEGVLHILPHGFISLQDLMTDDWGFGMSLRALGITVANIGAPLGADCVSAQSYADARRTELEYISSLVIPAVDYTETPRDFNCPNVSVCIAKDPYADDLVVPPGMGTAAIGAVLGGMCVRKVSESLGSVDIEEKPGAYIGQPDYTLTDTLTGRWLTAQLTDGTELSSLSLTATKDLTARGFIFVDGYLGYAGQFFNSDPTCTIMESDYAYAHRNAIWDKAAILVRNALIPKVKGRLPKRDGKIVGWKVQELKGVAYKPLKELMMDKGEIDAAEIIINPAQTVTESDPLEVSIRVQAGDILHEINVSLGVVNEL